MSGAPAVLFDLDGTLTDSSVGIFRCFRHAFARLAEAGGPTPELPEDAQLGWIVGPPLLDSFAKLAGAAEAERLIGFYRERYRVLGAFENLVYDGVEAALTSLAEAGARLFVATSKNEVDARMILDHFQLGDRFESINGARPDGSRSGKHDLISDIIAAHDLDPSSIVMVGDREYDMRGAKSVGVRAIGVLYGYGSAEELTAAGADALAATPEEAAALALKR